MWINILLFLLAVIFLVPIYICIVTAFKTPAETAVSTWSLPKGLDLSNFAEAMEKSNLLQSFGNSIFITVVSTLGIVLFSAMMAYSICRNQESRLYRMFGSALFIGIMIPFQVIMIPVYKMFKNMGLLNTYRGIIILMIASQAFHTHRIWSWDSSNLYRWRWRTLRGLTGAISGRLFGKLYFRC